MNDPETLALKSILVDLIDVYKPHVAQDATDRDTKWSSVAISFFQDSRANKYNQVC